MHDTYSSSSGADDEWEPNAKKRRARKDVQKQAKQDTPATQASDKPAKPNKTVFRGVTRHIRTGRFESHIWHKNRQLYLGGFDTEGQAAMAYDMAAINIKGTAALTNFDISRYEKDLTSILQVRMLAPRCAPLSRQAQMKEEDLVTMLRNKGKGKPAKTSSRYKGVTRHANRNWEARISCGNRRYTYLGVHANEKDATRAFDMAALAKDIKSPTNFHISCYVHSLSTFCSSRTRIKPYWCTSCVTQLLSNCALPVPPGS